MKESMQDEGLARFNQATLEDFLAIHGVDEKRARAVVEFRDSLPGKRLQRWDDLCQVKGIGDQWVNFFREQFGAGAAGGKRKPMLQRLEFWGCGFLVALAGLAVALFGVLVDWQAVPPLRKTPTPSPAICKVMYEDASKCIYLFETPNSASNKTGLPCLPIGTEVEVVGLVPGNLFVFYEVASYRYDAGPIVITEIGLGSPAEEIGLQVGDVILRIDGRQVDYRNEMTEYIDENAGRRISLVIQRNGQELTKDVVPRVSPSEGQGAIGFRFEGGIARGGSGYIATMHVTCAEGVEFGEDE